MNRAKNLSSIMLSVGTVLILSGCGDNNHSVKEFLNNKSLRSQYDTKCSNGELSVGDQNCLNVNSAKMKIAEDEERPSNTANWSKMGLKK